MPLLESPAESGQNPVPPHERWSRSLGPEPSASAPPFWVPGCKKMDHDETIQEQASDLRGMTALLMATMQHLVRLTLLAIRPRDNSDMEKPSVGVVAVGLGFSGLFC